MSKAAGDVPLSDVTVTDDLVAGITCPKTSLALLPNDLIKVDELDLPE